MTQLNIPDKLYKALKERAAAVGQDVDTFAAVTLTGSIGRQDAAMAALKARIKAAQLSGDTPKAVLARVPADAPVAAWDQRESKPRKRTKGKR